MLLLHIKNLPMICIHIRIFISDCWIRELPDHMKDMLMILRLRLPVVPPDITVDPSSLTGFTYVAGGGPSLEKSFTVSGINLTADISITASANYEISTTSGSGYTSPITLIQNGGTVNDTTIYVRLKAGLNAGNYFNEDITASSTGAIDKTVTCSGTVIPPPDPRAKQPCYRFTATTGDPTYSVINVAWLMQRVPSSPPPDI